MDLYAVPVYVFASSSDGAYFLCIDKVPVTLFPISHAGSYYYRLRTSQLSKAMRQRLFHQK